jgi:hypothetical protein
MGVSHSAQSVVDFDTESMFEMELPCLSRAVCLLAYLDCLLSLTWLPVAWDG